MVRKNKNARGKSEGPTTAKQPKLNPPVPAALQEVAQAQAPLVAAEGIEVVADGNSTAHPNVGQVDVSGGSS